MGAFDKGRSRSTSITNRQILTNQIMTPVLTSGTRMMLVHFLALLFPQLAPFVYAAYLIYKLSERAIFAYKQYEVLRTTMSEQHALLVASGFWALREGMIYVTDQFKAKAINDKFYPLIASFVASDNLSKITLEMVRKDKKKNERLQDMLEATIAQFVTGAMTGSNDPMIQEAAKLLV